MGKNRFNIYLNKELHKEAKKRAIDLDMNLSQYISNLIKLEIKTRQRADVLNEHVALNRETTT